jgi:hypothetical protein
VFKSTLSALLSSDSGGILSLVCNGKIFTTKEDKDFLCEKYLQKIEEIKLISSK